MKSDIACAKKVGSDGMTRIAIDPNQKIKSISFLVSPDKKQIQGIKLLGNLNTVIFEQVWVEGEVPEANW